MTRDNFLQEGDGLFRESGKLPPDGRKLLEQVGNEEITSLELVRTPLSSFTKGFLNLISLGQFDKISKKYYDEIFHLSLWINGKYNLEKNEVVNFSRTNPKKSNSQVKVVNKIPNGITIQMLIDNTIKRMGPDNFSRYTADKFNCQNFLINVLSGSGIGEASDQDFIFQDASKIFKELPEFSKVLGQASVDLSAIFNRLIKGEGQVGGARRMDEQTQEILNDVEKEMNATEQVLDDLSTKYNELQVEIEENENTLQLDLDIDDRDEIRNKTEKLIDELNDTYHKINSLIPVYDQLAKKYNQIKGEFLISGEGQKEYIYNYQLPVCNVKF